MRSSIPSSKGPRERLQTKSPNILSGTSTICRRHYGLSRSAVTCAYKRREDLLNLPEAGWVALPLVSEWEAVTNANAPGRLLPGAVRGAQFHPRSPTLRHFATLADHRHRRATGIKSLSVELTAKRLGLLRELAPQATRFVVLVNPNDAVLTDAIVKDVHASVPTLGFPVEILHAGNSDRDIEAAFANLSQKPGAALRVSPTLFFHSSRID